MSRFILLDAGVLGLLCSSPMSPNVQNCRKWLDGQGRAGTRVQICELSDFEVRRELLRLGATAKLRRLDDLCALLGTVSVDAPAWLRASEFWALLRQAGLPTAAPDALDCDVVLCGVAATIGNPGDQILVATGNTRHFQRLPGINAQAWDAIT